MGRPKGPGQQAERAVQSPTGRSGRRGTMPAHGLLRPTSLTRALASDSSHLRTASPIGRPGPKYYFRLRPRVSDRGAQKPCSPLFSDWHDQSRLGLSDRGRPLGKDQGTNGESKPGRTSQTKIPGTIPYTPTGIVLCNRPNTNSIIGIDIFLYSIVGVVKLPYGKAPHVPLGIDSVVGAGIYLTE